MSPVAHESRYYRASRMAYRAWANSQPQYVIPGVLEEVDVYSVPAHTAAASISSSPPPSSPQYLPGVAGSTPINNNTGTGRSDTPRSERGRSQEGDILPWATPNS